MTQATTEQKYNRKSKTPQGRKANCTLIKNKMRKTIEDLGNLHIAVNYILYLRHKGLAKDVMVNCSASQGCNEGGKEKEDTIPRASNHCEGRREVPTTLQVLSSIQYICFRKTSGSNMRAPNLLRRHLTSLRPCSQPCCWYQATLSWRRFMWNGWMRRQNVIIWA